LAAIERSAGKRIADSVLADAANRRKGKSKKKEGTAFAQYIDEGAADIGDAAKKEQ